MKRTSIPITLLAALALAVAPAWAQDPPKEEEEVVEEEATQEPAAEESAGDEEGEEETGEEAAEEAEPEPSPYLAVVGGDVHTVTQGVIVGGTVLCKDDRILKVGRRVRVPEGARKVDARGMQVYPGLIAVDSGGIVSGRGDSVRDQFDPFALNVDLALAGGLTCVVSGDAVVKLTRGRLDGALFAKSGFVRLNYSTTSPRGRAQLRDELRKVRDFLREHRAWELAKEMGEEDLEEPKPEGLNEEYLALLRGEATARFGADGLKDLLATCDLLEEYPMQSVIYGGQEAWACAGRLGRVNARLVIHPRDKSWADESLNRPSGWSIENAAELWDHGVEFAILPRQRWISTGGLAGRDLLTLPMEAAFAIRGGLPQEAALRAITLDAAKILGVEDRLGSLEAGKDADLIVCDGDLFHYRSFVQWAVVEGRVVYDKQKAPYFAHIRPRAEPSMAEVIEGIERAAEDAADDDAEEEDEEDGEEEAGAQGSDVDAPEDDS